MQQGSHWCGTYRLVNGAQPYTYNLHCARYSKDTYSMVIGGEDELRLVHVLWLHTPDLHAPHNYATETRHSFLFALLDTRRPPCRRTWRPLQRKAKCGRKLYVA